MLNQRTYSTIFTRLSAGGILLTPNRRLSAALHRLYQQYQLHQEKKCWATPDILPFTSWIERCWLETHSKAFLNAPHLLNPAQEQFLWEKILSQAKHSDLLLQVSETADIARSAWGLLKQWQVDLKHPMFNSAEDYAALASWAGTFQKICEEHHWRDGFSLTDELIKHINEKKFSPPATIILAGFTENSPQMLALLASCQRTGSAVMTMEAANEAPSCHRIGLLDFETEVITMARWAKSTWCKDKEKTIGCVIPSLEKSRDRVLQLFSEVFAEETTYTIDMQSSPFNISAGKSLLQYPLIHTALQLLMLHKKIIPAESFRYLLSSPFVGEGEMERLKRFQYDSLLRKDNLITVDLSNTARLAKVCPLLAKRITQFLAAIEKGASKQLYSEWAKTFNHLLTTLGWPGERSLNSEEYQIVDCWLNLLTQFSSLDQVSQPVSINLALKTLQKMASHSVFQPKTPSAPIQILGVLEAAGSPFDYLWVAGMDDVSWPPQPRPNPFIPKGLQRERQMPHATAERELKFCMTLTRQFKQNAASVIFSHARKNDELELQASALIRDLSEIDISQLNIDNYLSPHQRIFQTRLVESFTDDQGPMIAADEKVRGGVSVIKQQALCPFKAFAEWRLHAHELESPLPGLRAKDRGTVIHKTMEALWNRLVDQAHLIAIPDEELYALLNACTEETLNSLLHLRSGTQYLALEKERLAALLWDWLQVEKARPPFKVWSNEKTAELSLNQLTLSVKIDRIDELADGKRLIIDYKTGKNNEINSWFSDRPDEPQLPLYSLLAATETVGITFAQLSTGNHCFKGVSDYSLDIAGVKILGDVKKATAASWTEQLEQWRANLTKLSDDFYNGVAFVDPKDAQTCVWCALKPLCRVNELL